VIPSFDPSGEGKRVKAGLYHDSTIMTGDNPLYAAKVRNGFVAHTRREVFAKLRGLKIAKCPFVNLPEKKRTLYSLTSEEMKKCVWLKPERVAQIEFAEWTPDGHLRPDSPHTARIVFACLGTCSA